MRYTVNKKTVIILSCLLALGACSSVKKELGVGRNSPDEFMVVKRAPLSLPPDYSLRPPSDSDVAPASEASNQAKTLLMGEGAEGETTAAATGSEGALLQKMGAAKADPNIRSEINRENGYMAVENQKLVDKLIFWKDEQEVMDDDVDGSVVNPGKESERLKKNEEEGKPVNEGKVPTIEKKKGVVDRIF
jgi:hypothetical protein